MQVGFETEGTAIFDTMQYVTNEVRCLAWHVWHVSLQRNLQKGRVSLAHMVLNYASVCPEKCCTRVEKQYSRLRSFSPPAEQFRNVCGVQVHTVGVGVAIGQSCMLLSAGTKGKRFMLPHATGKLPVISLQYMANLNIQLFLCTSFENQLCMSSYS